MAISISDIEYTPNPMVAGKKVKATCKVTADEEMQSVKIYDPEYRALEAKDVEGNGVYMLETDVPYDAPPGTYYITVVATDKKGDTERKSVSIKIG